MRTHTTVPRLCQYYPTRSEHNINSDCVAGLSKAVGFLLSSLGLSEGTRIKGFTGFILQVLVLFFVDVNERPQKILLYSMREIILYRPE